jgi:hypothetical protein
VSLFIENLRKRREFGGFFRRLYCLSTIFKKANDKIKKIADRETWEILAVTEYPGATLLVSALIFFFDLVLKISSNSYF